MSQEIILDTSVLIRFFTRDDESKAKIVKTLLESEHNLILIESVLQELVFTLLKVYSLTKEQVEEILQFLLSRVNIVCSAEIRAAVRMYEESAVSITDCLVLAHGKKKKVATYDMKLRKLAGKKSQYTDL